MSARCFTTLAPRPFSVLFPSLPVYIWKLAMYLFEESASAHTFIPLFTGFIGIYCFRDDRPLKGIIASSTQTFFPGLYTDWNDSEMLSMMGWTLPSFLYSGLPGDARVLLSTKWRYLWSSKKRSLVILEAVMVGVILFSVVVHARKLYQPHQSHEPRECLQWSKSSLQTTQLPYTEEPTDCSVRQCRLRELV